MKRAALGILGAILAAASSAPAVKLTNQTTGQTMFSCDWEDGPAHDLTPPGPAGSQTGYTGTLVDLGRAYVYHTFDLYSPAVTAYEANQFLRTYRTTTGIHGAIRGEMDAGATSSAGETIVLETAFYGDAGIAAVKLLDADQDLSDPVVWLNMWSSGGAIASYTGATEYLTLTFTPDAWNTLEIVYVNGAGTATVSINGGAPEAINTKITGNIEGLILQTNSTNTEFYWDAASASDPDPPGPAPAATLTNQTTGQALFYADWEGGPATPYQAYPYYTPAVGTLGDPVVDLEDRAIVEPDGFSGIPAYQGGQFLRTYRTSSSQLGAVQGHIDAGASSSAGDTIVFRTAFHVQSVSGDGIGVFKLFDASAADLFNQPIMDVRFFDNGEIQNYPGGYVPLASTYTPDAWNTVEVIYVNGAGTATLSINDGAPETFNVWYAGNVGGLFLATSSRPSEIMWDAAAAPAALRLAVTHDGAANELTFRWNSRAGKHYDLLSATSLDTAPATWPVYQTYEDIPADESGTNTLASVTPDAAARFFVVAERDPLLLLGEDFEGGALPAGWSLSDNGNGTAWGVGVPDGGADGPGPPAEPEGGTGGPGTHCAGTHLLALYTADASAALRTPARAIPAGGATLSFQQWIDTESDQQTSPDFGAINVLDASGTLLGPLTSDRIVGFSTAWAAAPNYSLDAYAGQTIKLEFLFTSNATDHRAGWYIDDVSVTGKPGDLAVYDRNPLTQPGDAVFGTIVADLENDDPGRCSHGGPVCLEYADGDIAAFYANTSDHNIDGWSEYALSSDGGRTWSKYNKVAYSYDAYLADPTQPAWVEEGLVTGDGTAVLFITHFNTGGARSENGFMRSLDHGATWSEYQELDSGFAGYPCAVAVSGDTSYVLIDSNAGPHVLYASTDDGQTWQQRSTLTLDDDKWYGAMCIMDDGRLLAGAYSSADEGHFFYCISDDDGLTWGAQQAAVVDKKIRDPELACLGGLYYLHGRSGHSGTGAHRFVLYTSEDGENWNPGLIVSSDTQGPDGYSHNCIIHKYDPATPNELMVLYSIIYAGNDTNEYVFFVRPGAADPE